MIDVRLIRPFLFEEFLTIEKFIHILRNDFPNLERYSDEG